MQKSLVIFGLALIVRSVELLASADRWPNPIKTGMVEEILVARGLSLGLGFVNPFWDADPLTHHPSAYSPPAYPVMLAALIRMAGGESEPYARPYRIAVIANLMIGSLTVVLLASAGRRVRKGSFWWIGVLGILWPTLVSSSTIIWYVPLTGLCLATAVYLACANPIGVEKEKRNRIAEAVAIGLVAGLCSLVNPVVAPVFLILLMGRYLLARRPGRRWAPFVISGAVWWIALMPWLVRNAVAFHQFIPIRSSFPLEAWRGNHPISDGTSESTFGLHPTDGPAERALYHQLYERAYMDRKKAEFMEIWRRDSGRVLQLSARRIGLFWLGNWERPSRFMGFHFPMWGGCNIIKMVLNGALVGLSLCGWMRLRSWRLRLFFLVGLVCLPLPYYLTHVAPSFRIFADVLVVFLAGVGMAGRAGQNPETAESRSGN